jgi:putative redox protein
VSAETETTVSKVGVEWVDGEVFVGSDHDGHSIVFDSHLTESADVRKAPPRGIGPMNALLTSLGACSGMEVVAILIKRKQRLGSLRVEVSGKRNRYGYPKPFSEIHVKYLISGEGLEEKYVKEAVNDTTTKYCSVATTINEKAKITFSYEVSRA